MYRKACLYKEKGFQSFDMNRVMTVEEMTKHNYIKIDEFIVPMK